MKPISVKTDTGRLSLVSWLERNDPDFLKTMEITASIFGPLQDVKYLNNDPDKQRSLYQHMKAEAERIGVEK
jgi:hypothetical protein